MDGSAAPAPSRARYFPPRAAGKQDVAQAPLIANMFSLQLFIKRRGLLIQREVEANLACVNGT
jgi:hypothetical protein